LDPLSLSGPGITLLRIPLSFHTTSNYPPPLSFFIRTVFFPMPSLFLNAKIFRLQSLRRIFSAREGRRTTFRLLSFSSSPLLVSLDFPSGPPSRPLNFDNLQVFFFLSPSRPHFRNSQTAVFPFSFRMRLRDFFRRGLPLDLFLSTGF